MTNFVDLWVYLSGSPLLWLTTTLLAYLAADAISAACGRHPLANPVLIAVTFVSIIVVATGTPFPAISPAPSSCISCSARRRSPSRFRSCVTCHRCAEH